MTMSTINTTQITEVQPMPGAELRPRFEYADGKRTDTPVTRDGLRLYRMSALAVVPLLGYQQITIETTTPPEKLQFEAAPSTRLQLSGMGELTMRGGDFGSVVVTIFAPTVSVAMPARRGGDE